MEIYNTLSRRKEELKTIADKKVSMYVCGPTVYDYNHIGHARTYLSFDLLKRFLKFLGYDVEMVVNITDVGHLVDNKDSGEDKMEKRAKEKGMTMGELADFFTQAHLKDLGDLNVLLPEHNPKASENIKEIIEFVEGLIEKGYAYETPNHNVYFNVAKKADYGKLSQRTVSELVAGTRVESADDKHSSADFALWKSAPSGAREFIWPSPWGQGYPGWHIECSVMSRKYLGDTFDIHGSAVENVFPHHENEIAQTEALTGKPMANYWVHSGMLTINGTKMSKSLHNTLTVQDALKQYSANEIRLALYSTHYRKPFDYTSQVMAQGVALRKRIFEYYEAQQFATKTDQSMMSEIESALSDDLDTPKALSLWMANLEQIDKADTAKLFEIFGLKFEPIEADEQAMKLVAQRLEARDKKDYLTSDNRKAEIVQLGYDVLDTPKGTKYIPR